MRVLWRQQRIKTGFVPRTRLQSSSRQFNRRKNCPPNILLRPRFPAVFRPPFGTFSLPSQASPPLHEDVYIPDIDLENFEDYAVGGFHPTVIGDTFHNGRYEVAHKLGFGGFSTVWLARDNHLERYVSLKIMVAHESSKSTESSIFQLLSIRDGPAHQGQQFIPRLLDQFSFDGPNGRHTCLVQEPAGCSIAASKDNSIDFLFPVETARSIAAQLIMGVAYLHSRCACHGGMFIQPSIHRFIPQR
jgi:serine/threonine-protein kinase SRPK3